MAAEPDPLAWAEVNADFFEDVRYYPNSSEPAFISQVIENWREAGRLATGRDDIEFAAAFTRHLTKRGTGLPVNFFLAATRDEVRAFEFNPQNAAHPISLTLAQVGDPLHTWPRGMVRCDGVEKGRLAYGMTLHLVGDTSIPCRAPRFPQNPAAAYAVSQLGGELPR